MPGATLMYRPKRTHYKLRYNTRVMRPDVGLLNPYRDESDPENIRQGNPNLKGEYAHKLNADISRRFTTGIISGIELSYSIETTDKAIKSYTFIDAANIATTTYGNLGSALKQMAEVGIDLRESRNGLIPIPHFRFGYSRAAYTFASKEKNIVEGFQGSVTIPVWRLGRKGPVARATYSISPSYASAQNRKNSYYPKLDITLSKYFRKLKMGGQIAVSDLLHGHKFVGETIGSDTFLMHSRRERQGRIFTFALYWHFGKFRDTDKVSTQGSIIKNPLAWR